MMESLIIAVIIALDQISKHLTDLYLSPTGTTVEFLPGVLNLTSAHNYGAAWSLLSGGRWFFVVLTIIVCGAVSWFLISQRKSLHMLMRISVSLILAGALGNFIDRLLLGWVRDMLEFAFIDFPIFNIADMSLTIGTALLIMDMLFFKGKKYFEALDKKTNTRLAQSDQGGEEE